ncbi:MAG: hypothetical protein LQ338_000527 [Usnochroma carphineum]|nr:MAG: hypothetical protein LQ338_000527 [Usnochroma carphineum]
MAIILSINAGSSSVKVSVYEASTPSSLPTQLAEASISGLTAPPATLTYSAGSENVKNQALQNIDSQESAFEHILNHLDSSDSLPQISHREDITHVCHRVVHGGDYPDAHVIDNDTYHHLEDLTDLAPLHNASALAIVKACMKLLPKAKNIAYFDSSFHASMPDAAKTYPIDPGVANKNRLRKYGFHGISYNFITRSVAEFLDKKVSETNIIALHLGSGASACAVKGGKSLDNSMGLTPLAGLPGATRSGDVDPSLIFHFTHDAGKPAPGSSQKMHISQAEEILNKQSGWKALTGTTDFGHISSSADPECRLAFDIFVDRIVGFVGGYYVKLEGKVDALIFAGGIGEKADLLRQRVVEKCQCLGFEIDEQRNRSPIHCAVEDIGSGNARHRTLVCQTDEQFEMARQCARTL